MSDLPILVFWLRHQFDLDTFIFGARVVVCVDKNESRFNARQHSVQGRANQYRIVHRPPERVHI
jgi:hypothetical protein